MSIKFDALLSCFVKLHSCKLARLVMHASNFLCSEILDSYSYRSAKVPKLVELGVHETLLQVNSKHFRKIALFTYISWLEEALSLTSTYLYLSLS